MLERNRLHVDSLLSQKFYTEHKEIDQIAVGFPLPTSADSLYAFLNSADGSTFKVGLRAIIDKIDRWSTANGIINASFICDQFKITYADYTGSNANANKLYMPLYQFGLQHLASIATLAENNDIPNKTRVDIISNLLSDISVCAPGAYTHIANAYFKLASQLDIATEWVVARKSIAEQVIAENLKMAVNMPEGMEIHYINAVLNYYSDMLGITKIQDEYISICDENLLATQLSLFEGEITKALTAEAIIDHIIFEIDMQKLPEKFQGNSVDTEPFFHTIEHYGNDKHFYAGQLFVMDDMSIPKQLSWQAEYALFQTLTNRMTESGYFDHSTLQKTIHIIGEKINIDYLQNHSLKFAYAQDTSTQIPLIPYFVDRLNPGNVTKSQQTIVRLIISSIFTDDQRLDIANGILIYLHNNIDTGTLSTNNTIINNWVNTLVTILPNHYKFDVVLKNSPDAIREQYINKLGIHNLPALIQTNEELINVLSSLPTEKCADILRAIGYAKLTALLKNIHQFTTMLRHLPDPEWDDAFTFILNGNKNISVKETELTELLALVLSRISEDEWDSFFKKNHFTKDWLKLIDNMENLTQILISLPPNKARFLLSKFDSNQIKHVMERQNILFLTYYHWPHIIKSLNQLPKEQAALLLQHFGPTMEDTLSFRIFFQYSFNQLNIDKADIFLDFIGPKLLNKILYWQLTTITVALSLEKCKFLFNYAGTEKCRSAVANKEDLVKYLNQVSTEKADAFLKLYQLHNLSDLREDKKYFSFLLRSIKIDLLMTVLKQFDKDDLFSLITLHAKSLFKHLSKDKIAFIYSILSDSDIQSLAHTILSQSLATKSLALLMQLPIDEAKNILHTIGNQMAATLVKDRDQLVSIFNLLPPDNQLSIISNIGDAQLKKLLLDNHGLDDALHFIDQYRDNEKIHDLLLLSLLKAYHEKYTEDAQSRIPYVRFWNKPCKIEPNAFSLLTAAFSKNICEPKSGLTFFNQLAQDENQKQLIESTETGDLGKITKVFRSYS